LFLWGRFGIVPANARSALLMARAPVTLKTIKDA